jgi:hypothetical protein
MNKPISLLKSNLELARKAWGELTDSAVMSLRELTRRYRLNIAIGDLQYLDRRWYVTHSGLLRIAHSRGCQGMRTAIQRLDSDPVAGRWVFKATVYRDAHSKGFVGYGDADPSNTSPLVRGSEMRVAETRAVNRALRKAYGIGLCSVEELGVPSFRPEPGGGGSRHFVTGNGNGSHKSEPKLRDKLCLLIRKFELDPNQVKRYAADFCGTEVLRDAGRDLVESFITTLADEAAKDRGALICKLNSYGNAEAVKS